MSALTLASLAHQQIWVGWKQEMRAGRLTKVPYDPRTGRRAASDDVETWATRDEAQWWAATEHADGIGVMFCPVGGDAFLCGNRSRQVPRSKLRERCALGACRHRPLRDLHRNFAKRNRR